MTLPLNGKRALVTGASGALGSAIARRLSAMGAHVLLHGNSRPQAVQALADEISAAYAPGLHVTVADQEEGWVLMCAQRPLG